MRKSEVLVRVPDALTARVPEEASAALNEVGGRLDTNKTQVWPAEGGCPRGCEAWWRPAGLELLGGPLADEDDLTAGPAPLGSEGFVDEFLDARLRRFEAFPRAVEWTAEQAAPQLPRAQSRNLLLRTCGLGRLTHLARLLPPAKTADFAAAADKAVEATFARVGQLDALTPQQAAQTRLSLRRGGATGDFRLHGRLDRALLRGRWKGHTAARQYILEGMEMATRLQRSAGVELKILLAGRELQRAFSLVRRGSA